MEFEVCNPTKRSKIFCSVFGCNSKACRSPQLSFHRFPHPNRRCVLVENERGLKEKVDVLTAWKNALKFGKPVSKTMVVCSLHFKETDYFAHAKKVKRKCLKKTAVPSVNLPVTVTQLSPATKHVRRYFTVGEKEAVFNTFKKCGEDFLRYGKVAHMAEVSDRCLCKKWQEALKIGKPISKYMLVCSKHFTKDDFMPAIPETKRKRLKKGVVPSRNIPKTTQELPKNHIFKITPENKCRRLKRGIVPSRNLPTGNLTRPKSIYKNKRNWKYCIGGEESDVEVVVNQINLEHSYSMTCLEAPSDSGLRDQAINERLGLSNGHDTKKTEPKEKELPSLKLPTFNSVKRNSRRKTNNIPKEYENGFPVSATTDSCSTEAPSIISRKKRRTNLTTTTIVNIKTSNSTRRNNRRKTKNVPKEHESDFPALVTNNSCSNEVVTIDLTETALASNSTPNKSVTNVLQKYKKKNKLHPPNRHKRTSKVLPYVDEDTKRVVQSIINNFYIKNERPSIDKILAELEEKEDIHFEKSTFQTLLREMGFRYTTKRNYRTKLNDENEVVHFLPLTSSCPDASLWIEPSTSSTMDVPKTREVAIQVESSCRSVSVMCDMKRTLQTGLSLKKKTKAEISQ